MFRLLDNVLAAPQRCYLNSESRDKVLHDLDVRTLEGHTSTLLSQVWWSSEDPPQGSKTLWSSFLGGLARSSVSRTDWLQLHQKVKQRHHLAESRTAGELLLALPSQSSAAWWPMGEVGEHEHASPISPDQDHGYCSLEEEFLHMRRRYLAEPPPQEEQQPTQSSSTRQEEQEEVKGVEPVEEEQVERLALVPQCQNKSIAFIMGCPCSDDEDDDDDSSSQSEGHSSDEDDDDDGFDSEGSSDFSTSSGEDDPEAELLWASLCRSSDPYDPRNFTARLHTGPAPPRIPTPPPSCSSPLPLPSPSPADSWDDSTSASEADEADSLWASFSCSSDPYSPLNFQAPLRTCSGPPTRTAVQRTPSSSPSSCPGPAPAKRPDGGPSKTPSLSPSTKKVSDYLTSTTNWSVCLCEAAFFVQRPSLSTVLLRTGQNLWL